MIEQALLDLKIGSSYALLCAGEGGGIGRSCPSQRRQTKQEKLAFYTRKSSVRPGWTSNDLASTVHDDRPLLPTWSASETGLEGC